MPPEQVESIVETVRQMLSSAFTRKDLYKTANGLLFSISAGIMVHIMSKNASNLKVVKIMLVLLFVLLVSQGVMRLTLGIE